MYSRKPARGNGAECLPLSLVVKPVTLSIARWVYADLVQCMGGLGAQVFLAQSPAAGRPCTETPTSANIVVSDSPSSSQANSRADPGFMPGLGLDVTFVTPVTESGVEKAYLEAVRLVNLSAKPKHADPDRPRLPFRGLFLFFFFRLQ
jgi:hypothetical protein